MGQSQVARSAGYHTPPRGKHWLYLLSGVFEVCGGFHVLNGYYLVLNGFYGINGGGAELQADRHGEDVNPPSRAWRH